MIYMQSFVFPGLSFWWEALATASAHCLQG